MAALQNFGTFHNYFFYMCAVESKGDWWRPLILLGKSLTVKDWKARVIPSQLMSTFYKNYGGTLPSNSNNSRSVTSLLAELGITNGSLLNIAGNKYSQYYSHIEADDLRWVQEQGETNFYSSCTASGGSRKHTVQYDEMAFKQHTLFFWTIGRPKSENNQGFISRAKLRILTQTTTVIPIPKGTKVWLMVDKIYDNIPLIDNWMELEEWFKSYCTEQNWVPMKIVSTLGIPRTPAQYQGFVNPSKVSAGETTQDTWGGTLYDTSYYCCGLMNVSLQNLGSWFNRISEKPSPEIGLDNLTLLYAATWTSNWKLAAEVLQTIPPELLDQLPWFCTAVPNTYREYLHKNREKVLEPFTKNIAKKNIPEKVKELFKTQ